MQTQIIKIAIAFVLATSLSCSNESNHDKGSLYIIGGGKRPPEMVNQLINLSGITNGKYIIVLPMASSEPDSAAFWAMKQFQDLGVSNITYYNIIKDEELSAEKLDSLENAGMIYISGGDQSLFMNIVKSTPVEQAIKNAYKKGAIIAGTSAGAAVMSKKMITGKQVKQPLMNGYRTIQPGNIELSEGLGLVSSAIIDQHFIWRERMNRLISVAIENPNELAIGIDESTAILVKGDSAKVYGTSQVVVLNSSKASTLSTDSLLGAKRIELSIFIPGQRFSLKVK